MRRALQYLVSLLLNPRVNLNQSALENLELLDASLVIGQVGLLLYLVCVSFWKADQVSERLYRQYSCDNGLAKSWTGIQLWVKAKEQVEGERRAEAAICDHLQYFNQLRRHFYGATRSVVYLSIRARAHTRVHG